jgi:hypothetical protein
MNIVNNDRSETLLLEGGIKRTETSTTENVGLSSTIDGYLDTVTLETGNMFDFGFRISNDNGDTPDDLFVADAPWGLDDSAAGTNVIHYAVKVNEETYRGEGYPIERNIDLEATTSNYIGVYRALSPRFAAVDLSDYANMVFTASGTGILNVRLIKGDGEVFFTKISLSEESKTYNLEQDLFKNEGGQSTDFSDIKVLTFEMPATIAGTLEQKQLKLSNIEFTNAEQPRIFIDEDITKSVLSPNPLSEAAFLYFFEQRPADYVLELFDLSGKSIASHTQKGSTQQGENRIQINRNNLGSGIYFYRLKSSNKKIWSGRLLVK